MAKPKPRLCKVCHCWHLVSYGCLIAKGLGQSFDADPLPSPGKRRSPEAKANAARIAKRRNRGKPAYQPSQAIKDAASATMTAYWAQRKAREQRRKDSETGETPKPNEENTFRASS